LILVEENLVSRSFLFSFCSDDEISGRTITFSSINGNYEAAPAVSKYLPTVSGWSSIATDMGGLF